MAIIYTYPVKATPNDNDLILISDSEDSNKTKQVKISTLPGGSGSGVSSVTAVLPLASTGGSTPAVSLTGLTGFGTAGQVIKVNSGADGLEWGTVGGSTSPDTPTNSVQFNNAGAFGGSANLTFATNTLAITHTVDIKGDGTNAGKLKLYCPNTTTPHAVTIEGPAHNGASDYTLKLPSPAPSNQQILQSDGSGVLSWINTPSSGSGGAVDSVNTTDGTYIDLTPNAATTGAVTVTADLSAVDGTSTTATKFLSKDNTWDVPSYTTNTDANIGGTNLALTNNRTLNFYSDTSDKSLTFISTISGTKTLFKFDTVINKPRLTIGDTASTYEGTLDIKGNGSNRTGKINLYNAAGTNSINIQAPTTFGSASDIPYVLPSAQGTASTFLQNNGSGILTWATVSSGVTYTFSTGLSESGGTVTLDAGLNNLTDVSLATGANGSLYVGQISSQLSGTPVGNVTLGGGAAKVATTAYDNTIIGSDAAVAITEGYNNVAIGSDVAAALTTGINNVIIGEAASIASAALSSTTVVGQGASGAADSTVIGKGASASTNGTAIGSGASASGGGIAIGKDATAASNEIAIEASAAKVVTTGNTAAGDLKITINGTTYYIALRTYNP